MRLLAVIPARLGATRLPRKPLRLVGGAPLVVRVWEQVQRLEIADRCVVATDAEEIAAVVRAAGGEAVVTRADHPSGTDRVAEVVARAEFGDYDAVVNVQGDEPFVSRDALAVATTLVMSGRFAVGTVSAPASDDDQRSPDIVKVVAADDGRALYFSRAPIPWLRDATSVADRATHAARLRRHVGLYAYTRDALAQWVALPVHPLEQIEKLEQLRPLAHGIAIGVAHVDVAPPPGVDTEADLARADAHWSAVYASSTPLPSDQMPRPSAVASALGAAPHSAAAAFSPETVA